MIIKGTLEQSGLIGVFEPPLRTGRPGRSGVGHWFPLSVAVIPLLSAAVCELKLYIFQGLGGPYPAELRKLAKKRGDPLPAGAVLRPA